MSKAKTPVSPDQGAIPPNHRRFSDEFKRDAVRLVGDQQYSFKADAKAVGVSEKSLRLAKRPLEGNPRRPVLIDGSRDLLSVGILHPLASHASPA